MRCAVQVSRIGPWQALSLSTLRTRLPPKVRRIHARVQVISASRRESRKTFAVAWQKASWWTPWAWHQNPAGSASQDPDGAASQDPDGAVCRAKARSPKASHFLSRNESASHSQGSPAKPVEGGSSLVYRLPRLTADRLVHRHRRTDRKSSTEACRPELLEVNELVPPTKLAWDLDGE